MQLKISKLFIFIFISIGLVGCGNDTPDPDMLAEQFLEDYENQNYEAIYQMLTDDVHTQISREDFISWYEEADETIQALNRVLSLEKVEVPEDEEAPEGEQYYLYSLEVETNIGVLTNEGRVKFELVEMEEEKEWKIDWTPGLLLPQIDYGDGVQYATINPTRGEIYDRNGEELAVNGKLLQVAMVLGRMEGKEEEMVKKASELLDLSEEFIEEKLNQSWVQPDHLVPIVELVYDGNEELMEILQETSKEGLTFQTIPGRQYPLGAAAAHLTGYLGNIQAEQLEELKEEGYTESSKIGRAGLEALFEKELRGQLGGKISIVSEDGKEKDVLIEKEAVDGEQITLSIDANIQKKAYDQLINEHGTNVTMNPVTGEVLALVSMPTYNPNDFIVGMSNNQFEELNNHPGKPFIAKFNQSFTPGSTIKPITAAIAIENSWDPNAKIDVPENDRWQKDDSWGNHFITRVSGIPLTSLNLSEAMVYSDNIYFAKLALETGEADIASGLEAFGFGEKLDFSTNLATSTYANENGLNRDALLADTGYGQGELLVNPLHLAVMFTSFLHEGSMIQPRLVASEQSGSFWKEQVISAETANTVKQTIIDAVQNQNATGHAANISAMNLAGKTGTAEHKSSQEEEGPETGWFIALNDGEPEVLSLMMIENVENKGGSRYVAEKVKQVLEAFN
ncbi:penicillin-binding transpeptidase domain-containing protein [Alkalihalobacillus sp. 1P02AB]|uniref:penicillin-binding transpeptidase domain-containing protein n=1 Tax=Alkalihalobacillus sp. 1P02AB TaxID=3132260 RepID=UPI0039A657ED